MADDPSSKRARDNPTGAPALPDPDATGSGAPLPPVGGSALDPHPQAREAQERDAAWRRGRERRHTAAGLHEAEVRTADRELAQHAFSALAENVRDYAIFLMDADGIIRYWGEGAHLMKRWTREQVEGGHLRLLYPDGGAEDGTAEAHLRDAAAHGEWVGQGTRVRGDGTNFWAQVTLTALKADDGTLLGFTKVTRDLSAQHAAEVALALRAKADELGVAHGERANLLAEIAVLKEELGVLSAELGREGIRGAPPGDTRDSADA